MAFDQQGRFGKESFKSIATTAQPAPLSAPEIIYVRVKNLVTFLRKLIKNF